MKKIKIIVLFAILMLIGVLNSNVMAATHGIIDGNGNSITSFEEGDSIFVDQRGATETLGDLTLNHDNVLCVQHGKEIRDYTGTYSVSETYTVEDPGLAYLLYNAANSSTNFESTWKSTWQKSVWSYLDDKQDSGDTDIKNILGSISIAGYSFKYKTPEYKEYVKKINNFEDVDVSVKKKTNNVAKVVVTGKIGDAYEYKYKTGSNSYQASWLDGTEKKWEINHGGSGVSVKVREKVSKYIVEYVILKRSNSQRILIVTKTDTNIDSVTVEDTLTGDKPDVSLQKMVVAVGNGSKDYTVEQNGAVTTTEFDAKTNTHTYNKRRRMKTEDGEDNAGVKDDISESVSVEGEIFKQDVPVTISLDDTPYVTYRILIYNNSDIEIPRVSVYDRLPYYKDSNGNIINYSEIQSVKQYRDLDGESGYENVKNITGTEVTTGKHANRNTLQYMLKNLKAGETRYLLIKVKFVRKYDAVLTNTAWINNLYQSDETTKIKNAKEHRTVDRDYVQFNVDVSIQKFITHVNETRINQDRWNFRAHSTGASEKIVDDICYVNGGSKVNKVTNTSYYKKNDPVEIEVGSTVTYKVEVYNNTNINAKNIIVKDIIPSNATLVKATLGSDNYNIKDEFEISGTTCEYGLNLRANTWTYFFMTLKFNSGTSGNIYTNTVEIASVGSGNDTARRTKDEDYVIVRDYKVSLEKYISKVTNKNGGDASNPTGREWKRHNESLADGNANKNVTKKNDPIELEVGDKVTYTIKLTNEGTGAVRINQIYDSFGYSDGTLNIKNANGTKNVGLKYVPGSISASSGVTASWNNATYGSVGNNYDRHLIDISGNNLLTTGNSIYIYLTFEVDIPTNYTNINRTLFNKAGIIKEQLYNNFGVLVKDGDGTDNNYDMDWVKTKKYAVSLEKYVYRVQNATTTWSSADDAYLYRANHPEYNPAEYSKSANPVMLEKGDKVIFRIVIRNTGTNTTEYGNITSFTVEDKAVPGLAYDYCQTNVTPSAGNTKFTYTGTIVPGGYVTFDIKYTIDDNAVLGQIIKNTAKVLVDLKNKNDKTVKDSDEDWNNEDSDYVKTKIYKVKLEKFVYAVNGIEEIEPDVIRKDHPIYKPDGFDKEKNPVLVNKGDTVTYKIVLTNKGEDSTIHGRLDKIIIEDVLPRYLKYLSDTDPVVSGCSSGTVVYDRSNSKIQWTGVLGLESSVEFNLTYKVKNLDDTDPPPQGSKICNTASIVNLYNKNLNYGEVTDSDNPNDDNADQDWIRIRVTAVAIEKFVTEVTSLNGAVKYDQESGEYKARDGLRFNEYYNQSYSNLGPKNDPTEHKKNNHVKVEPGDIVTFTIKLQNTGELPVKIDQFYDSYSYYWSNSDHRYGTGLEYVEGSIKNVSPNSKISNITIDSQEYSKATTEIGLRRYLINVGWNDYLAPMAEEEIEVQFKILSPIPGKVLLWNKVGIVKITDRYNNNFTWHIDTPNYMAHNDYTKEGDYDGPNNNYDMDFLEIQEYKVSLQKVVTQILNSDTIIGNRWDSWESHANTCDCKKCDISNKKCDCGATSWNNMGCICALYSKECVDSNTDQICDNCNHDMKYASLRDVTGNIIRPCEHIDEQENEQMKYAKHNNPVSVANGDFVRFAVRVRNDADTRVKVTQIIDELPAGVELQYVERMLPDGTNTMLTENTTTNLASIKNDINSPSGEYIYNRDTNILYIFPQHANGLLAPQETDIYYVTVKVTETNMSVDVMRNYAYINWIRNKNEYTETKDVTTGDNDDADYIQMKDIEISGIVWNDRALDKTQENYNGMYDVNDENVLEGVIVKLYRLNENGTGSTLVAQKVTGSNGKYTFTRDDIATFNVIKHQCEQYIKGPYKCIDAEYTGTSEAATHGANYWDRKYYSYYIVFEYDGITYTSTVYTELVKDNQLNPEDINVTSNAREKEKASDSFDGLVEQSRTEFNNRYETINSNGAVSGENTINLIYDTKNESGYIPSSIYNHEATSSTSGNHNVINMQSSTQKIGLSKNAEWEEKLQHVNIGLRGRDIFDLELTSDVAQVEVTVNKQKGVYKYQNKVEIRESDIIEINGTTLKQDAANVEDGEVREVGDNQTAMTAGVVEEEQAIRALDLNPDTVNTVNAYKHEDGLQSIFVTYEITVTNASQTNGVATKITNYYDKKYDFIGAYANLADAEIRRNDPEFLLRIVEESDSNPNYNYKTIETKWDTMTQGEFKNIYIVYKLIPEHFSSITAAGLATYNMAEITEYKTSLGEGQTEFTKGLIDKDSAPGSANKEQVRTIDTEGVNTATIGGNPTTVQYYFEGTELEKLKYEDDTYATPTLYFRKLGDDLPPPPGVEPPPGDKYIRTITGTVFEDLTKVHPTTKIKTGNGKLDEGEVGVYGARVQLIELSDGQVVRYETHTDKDGKFIFKGFLPGNYIIKYFYGDSANTVLINKTEHNGTKINAKSYNGEDFQSTNNSYDVDGMDTNKLNRTPNYWYLYNESQGISTAIDDSARRLQVSENVTAFIDEQMEVLNNIRDGRANVDVSYTLDDGITTNTITIGTIADPNTSMNIIPKTYMFAETEQMLLTVEKSELVDDGHGGKTHIQKTTFDEYKITNMNFGIAEVPVSTVDLQKQVKELKIKDATGENVLIGLKKETDGWKTTGDVIPAGSNIDVQIENEQLQGAKLEVRFTISVDIDTEVNYDGTSCIVPKITAVADFVNNNLSYNADLSYEKDGSIIKNSTNWEVATHEKVKDILKEQKKYDLVTEPKGTVDPEGTTYTTVLIATPANPLIGASEGYESVDIVLEKVLSSTELTIDEVITSTVDMSEYNNIVEIIGFDYITSAGAGGAGAGGAGVGGAGAGGAGAGGAGAGGAGAGGAGAGGAGAGGAGAGGAGAGGAGAGGVVETPIKVMRDRVRNPERYIILPGVQYDYASSETIVIHPPTGTTQIDTIYYVVAVIALGVLAAGVYGIKKFVIKK